MKTPREIAESIIPYHEECEDAWYSCPLSKGGCLNTVDAGCTCFREQRINDIEKSIIAYGNERIEEAANVTDEIAAWANKESQTMSFYYGYDCEAHDRLRAVYSEMDRATDKIRALKTKKEG